MSGKRRKDGLSSLIIISQSLVMSLLLILNLKMLPAAAIRKHDPP